MCANDMMPIFMAPPSVTGLARRAERSAALAIRTAAAPSAAVTRVGVPFRMAPRKSARARKYGSSAGSVSGTASPRAGPRARSAVKPGSAARSYSSVPPVPAAKYPVVNRRCCAPQTPATWVIAPEAWVSSTCAASAPASGCPSPRRVRVALTWVTSPATQRARSRSWIIMSSTTPPDRSRSANQADRTGNAPDR